MNILLDTCVWGGAKAELQSAGHDVVWTGEGDPSTIDLADASDILNKIIAAAIAEKKTAQPA